MTKMSWTKTFKSHWASPAAINAKIQIFRKKISKSDILVRLQVLNLKVFKSSWPSCSSPGACARPQPSWSGGTGPQEDPGPDLWISGFSGFCFRWRIAPEPRRGNHGGWHLHKDITIVIWIWKPWTLHSDTDVTDRSGTGSGLSWPV